MGKSRVVVLGSLVGVALALAPLSSAFADDRFPGNWSHGSRWGVGHGGGYAVSGGHNYGGHGYGYGYAGHGCYGCFWPLAVAGAVVGAVVNTAAVVVSAPFVALDAAANAAYYAPPAYGAPRARYDDGPPAYYNAPAGPAYYAPPARYYNNAPAPAYYGPPAQGYYRAAPLVRYYAPPAAPAYNYGPPPDYNGQGQTAPRY